MANFVQRMVEERKGARANHAKLRLLERYGICITDIDYARMEKILRWKPRGRCIEDGTAVYIGPAKGTGSRASEYWRFFWKGYVLDAVVSVHRMERPRANRERRGYNGMRRSIGTFLPPGTFDQRPWLLGKTPWHYKKLPDRREFVHE